MKFLGERAISGSRHYALLIEKAHYANRFATLDEINGRLQVEAKILEGPVNALSSVFFLLKYEHMVVEELL